MAVVVAEDEAPYPYALRGSGDGRQRGQRSKLVAKWLLDEMVAEQKRGEACLLGPMSRLHQLLGRADALPQESEPKRARMHHGGRRSLCGGPDPWQVGGARRDAILAGPRDSAAAM